jgi:hypothetical protein
MNSLFKSALTFSALILVFFCATALIIGNTAIYIQLHDTYFVFHWEDIALLAIAPSTSIFFFLRGLKKNFNSVKTNLGLILGLILMEIIFFKMIQMTSSMATNQGAIISSWVIFLLLLAGIVFVGIKIFHILKIGEQNK